MTADYIKFTVNGAHTLGTTAVNLVLKPTSCTGNYRFGEEETTISDELMVKVYPNPYSGMTNIEYEVATEEMVEIEVFNSMGAKVAVLNQGIKVEGIYHTSFSAKDLGHSSGLYILKVRVGAKKSVQRLIEN